MEFRQLKYFLVVAEEGLIVRAAEKLNITQPPLCRGHQYILQAVKNYISIILKTCLSLPRE